MLKLLEYKKLVFLNNHFFILHSIKETIWKYDSLNVYIIDSINYKYEYICFIFLSFHNLITF